MTSKAEEEEVVLVYTQGAEVPANVTKIIFHSSITEIPDNGNDWESNGGVFSQCRQVKEVVFNEQ